MKDTKRQETLETVVFTKDGSLREIMISDDHLNEALKSYFLTKPLLNENEQVVDFERVFRKTTGTYSIRLYVKEN